MFKNSDFYNITGWRGGGGGGGGGGCKLLFESKKKKIIIVIIIDSKFILKIAESPFIKVSMTHLNFPS